MNMNKYMTFTVKWQQLNENNSDFDSDTMMSDYSEPVDCKCFIYGKNIFIREEDKQTTVSAKVYLTLEKVKPKDKLDGQIVKSVNNYPESWDNKVQLYECLIWD